MKSESQSKSWLIAAFLTAMLLALWSPRAMGQSGEVLETCSNRTLSGNFGMLIEGTILGPNLPLRTVSMAHFDGTGSLSEVSHVVLNGLPSGDEWKADTASYIVNSDCTGVVKFNTPPGEPPLVAHFVVTKNGSEILGVVDGAAVTLTAHKVD